MNGYVSLRSILSLSAVDGMRRWCDTRDDVSLDIDEPLTVENAAWLYFRLEVAPDSSSFFPRGKWATLQRLQAELHKEAMEEGEK